ncbi:MAG TPA: entericidin A/B family lipoprotein [Candidatus Paceibacterota bacterium]|nr:entericidin A/B family lipoprotein [Candidatus Paceibacterota bacterium]
MKTLRKTLMCLLLLIAGITVFSGCRTAHGFGEDMENAGDKIQEGTSK